MIRLNNASRLPGTEKLFHLDPYLTECEATVLHVEGNLVVTDRTPFYAESGGQVADIGTIGKVRVEDVQKLPGTPVFIQPQDNRFGVSVPMVQIGSVFVHRCATEPDFGAGDKVNMKIDWDYRYANMRNHSASHFLFEAVRRVYPQVPPVKGCYIYNKSSRFDYAGRLNPARIPEVEAMANAWIARGEPIAMEPDKRTKEVSYWLYDDIVIPCGGTHVKSATELAPIRVKRKSQGKRIDRVYATLQDPEGAA